MPEKIKVFSFWDIGGKSEKIRGFEIMCMLKAFKERIIAEAQYTHDVVSTSVRRYERCKDVETTSCAYGEITAGLLLIVIDEIP